MPTEGSDKYHVNACLFSQMLTRPHFELLYGCLPLC